MHSHCATGKRKCTEGETDAGRGASSRKVAPSDPGIDEDERPWDRLPDELVDEVLGQISRAPRGVYLSAPLRFVCRRWNRVIGHAHAGGHGFTETCAATGRLALLDWGISQGCSCDSLAMRAAALSGSIDALQRLRLAGLPWSSELCTDAALAGHLDVMVWLRRQGCPWTCDAAYAAADNDRVDVLEWVLENGCDADMACVRWLAKTADGEKATARWLKARAAATEKTSAPLIGGDEHASRGEACVPDGR